MSQSLYKGESTGFVVSLNDLYIYIYIYIEGGLGGEGVYSRRVVKRYKAKALAGS